MNKEYQVIIRFDQIISGTVKIYAPDADTARTQAMAMMEQHKNPEVLSVEEVPAAAVTALPSPDMNEVIG